MRLALAVVVAAVFVAIAAVAMAARPVAQTPSTATTKSGMVVEEVRVGGSCVVVVTRAGAGASDDIAAVPCRP